MNIATKEIYETVLDLSADERLQLITMMIMDMEETGAADIGDVFANIRILKRNRNPLPEMPPHIKRAIDNPGATGERFEANGEPKF